MTNTLLDSLLMDPEIRDVFIERCRRIPGTVAVYVVSRNPDKNRVGRGKTASEAICDAVDQRPATFTLPGL